jgi:hypothetical protein
MTRMLPEHDLLRYSRPFDCKRKKNLPRRQKLSLETLESRLLLSVDLAGIPNWVEQGPGPTTDGQVSFPLSDDEVSGAVEAIAPHPTDPNIIYIGAVNGGVWRTTDGGANWEPLTDQLASLSIADIAFSPLDATNQTLFFGVGNYSSGGGLGGPLTGVFRTTDGGTTWESLGLAGEQIREVIPTSIGTGLADQVILVASRTNGLFRSTDGGDTFVQISGSNGASDGLDNDADGTVDEAGELNLPTGDVSHIAADPGNPNRFYAALPGANGGLFRSDDGGATWVEVNNGLTGIGTTTRIEVSVSAAPGNPVYVAFLGPGLDQNGNPGTVLANVFRSADQGANWTAIQNLPNVHPGAQGGAHFAILASATDANEVFIAGDRQPAFPFVANMFVGDASTNTWTTIVQGGAFLGSAPHADARDLVYDAAGNILHANDGGIALLFDPDGNTIFPRLWLQINGDLGITEFYSVAFDTVSSTAFGGTQDTGSTEQDATNNLVWNEVTSQAGDGGTADVANIFGGLFDVSQHFTMGNTLNNFVRRTFVNGVFLAEESLDLNGLVGADTSVTGFVVNPYVINVVDPNRLALGLNNLYESSDQGENVTQLNVGGATGVTAIVAGGRLNGVDNPEVIYAGVGGNLYLRSAAGPNLTQLTNYPGGTPTDIALHPEDWTRVYVTDGNAVWQGVDVGTTDETWTNITGNLGALTGRLQSVSVFSPTGTPGDEVVLVMGQAGVFRTRNPEAGANAIWTEYGAGLPNAVGQDVRYYGGTADTLTAATFGRGAWTVTNASDTLDTPAALVIVGDEDFEGQNDVIRLVRDEANPALLNVFLNSAVPVMTVQLSVLEQINVFGRAGNDTLIIDSSNGLINVPVGINYDGENGFDQLQLVQTDGPTLVSDTYSVGPQTGSGVSTIVGAGTAGTQVVFFENLSPVLDLVPAPLLTVNATAADNAISYVEAADDTHGLVTISEHESIEFANHGALTINAAAGQDTISLNNPSTPTGLTEIAVNGGDPSSGDALIVTGVGEDVTVNMLAATIAGASGADGLVSIDYSGIETLNLAAGIADLTLTTTAADDIVVVTPGLVFGANSGTVQSNGAVPQIAFVNSGTLTANLDGGDDAVVVNGSADPDTVAVSGTAVGITGRHTVNYSGAEALTVNGHAGSDTFNVTPSVTVRMFIDGGDPIGVLPGDRINIAAGGAQVTFNAGPETDEGSLVAAPNQPVSFDHIESIGITGGGPAVVNGTNGPDAITVIARDGSTHPGTDGVQDFTVSVNTGTELLFINTPSVIINALGGSDQLTLKAPAPNNAVWDVDVTVDGGLPAADADRLIVQTPVAGAETVTYAPTASDSGSMGLEPLSSSIEITGIEALTYDGLGDNDSLTIFGTALDDTIVHTPGAGDQAGSFQVNNLLALGYQNLGTGASLTAHGTGGTDTLIYTGTAANDAFVVNGAGVVGGAGVVSLNTRLPVNTVAIEALTLEGLDGDDTFTLVPAISDSVYQTMHFNGGGQSSATGDRVFLIGTAGDDDITISGQVVSLGGRTVASSGVENIRLDAGDGVDDIIYNGVSGVTENILVSSSGVVGSGQLSAPGVTLINFSNVERIDVNGNPPTPTETDTLTFAGTNAIDIFQIDLAAAATDPDPILQLQNSAGTTLLTLRSYTFFDTLRVLGLDGEDKFNVYTAATGPSRNLFVDGGLPTGKKKSTDDLNIFYTPPRPRIIHSTETQNPQDGIVDLDYDTARYVVQYADIEQVTIKRLVE